MLGLLLSWNKVCVAPVLKWVGYELLLREAKLGITASRALWLQNCMERLLAERVVRVADVAEGLGRASFVYGALDNDRPFLRALYNFVAHFPPDSVRPLPLYVLVTLRHLANSLSERRHTPARSRRPRGSKLGASMRMPAMRASALEDGGQKSTTKVASGLNSPSGSR